LVVSFGFYTDPWRDHWHPHHRNGWAWVGGYYYWGWWHPGYWEPVHHHHVYVDYVYVPGFWEADTVYVEGYYRSPDREGWVWVDGYYLEDGVYIRGHWVPAGDWPEGYLWEAGFFDGDQWMEGFWRPEFRKSFVWISSFYDADGIYNAGYWMPLETPEGRAWIPGWFDGNGWIDGYFVTEDEAAEDPTSWQPDPTWNRDAEPVPPARSQPLIGDDKPLAVPVPIPE
jgi:hypothetical protein